MSPHRHKAYLIFWMAAVLTLTILPSSAGFGLAQANGGAADTSGVALPLRQPGPTDRAEMEAFLDELFVAQMAEHHIAGAGVVVVKDGDVFFAKGYGYADLENKTPVDPEQTIFKIGSVGKLFTWTAIMQLVEQGRLNLDADINTYLDFRIPATYPQPITLKHLLTHTAGFEDSWLEVFARDVDDLLPVSEWLAAHIPARVRPPGAAVAYSNYGASLAGYIVARVSGLPYAQYVEEHILQPLGMAHTTARSPAPPNLRAQASLGYWAVDGVLQPVPDYPAYIGQPALAPAGGHSSSVADMARFMIAHLQDGRHRDADIGAGRLLQESTLQQMHSTLYTSDPRLKGSAYGFFDFSDNGQRVLGHSGSTLGFTALLLLLPDQDLGVFVAYNSEDSGELTTQHFGFQRAFFDHYFPAPAAAAIQPPADFAQRAGRFTGSYRLTQSAYTTLEKIGGIMIPVEISELGDGTLRFTIFGLEERLVEVAPLYFRQTDGAAGILFHADDRGRITHMYADLSPQYAFEKLNWYETPHFNLALVLGSVAIFLSVIPLVPISAMRNRRAKTGQERTSRGARVATWIMLGISALNLLFVAGTVQVFSTLGFPRFGIPLSYRIVLGLGVLSAVLTVSALVYTVLAWKERYWGVALRAGYTLATVAAIAFVWFLNQWNLLGWRY